MLRPVAPQLSISLDGTAPSLPTPSHRRAVREAACLRLADVAELLSVNISTISRWERGLIEPSGASRIIYAAFLGRIAPETTSCKNDAPPGDTSGASNKTDSDGLDATGYPR